MKKVLIFSFFCYYVLLPNTVLAEHIVKSCENKIYSIEGKIISTNTETEDEVWKIITKDNKIGYIVNTNNPKIVKNQNVQYDGKFYTYLYKKCSYTLLKNDKPQIGFFFVEQKVNPQTSKQSNLKTVVFIGKIDSPGTATGSISNGKDALLFDMVDTLGWKVFDKCRTGDKCEIKGVINEHKYFEKIISVKKL